MLSRNAVIMILLRDAGGSNIFQVDDILSIQQTRYRKYVDREGIYEIPPPGLLPTKSPCADGWTVDRWS